LALWVKKVAPFLFFLDRDGWPSEAPDFSSFFVFRRIGDGGAVPSAGSPSIFPAVSFVSPSLRELAPRIIRKVSSFSAERFPLSAEYLAQELPFPPPK